MTIIFYDIPSSAPGCAWSPNTWKVRYCLNYKQIPYKTEWIEYPDIEPHCKSLGILPTGKRKDGSDYYSLPAIHDPSTGVYVSDSFLIAEYLEKTYPDTHSVLPNNSWGLQAAFLEAYDYITNNDGSSGFIVAAECSILNPMSQEYFRRTREKILGKTLEEFVPQGEEAVTLWEKFKNVTGKIDAWYAKTDSPDGKKTPYLMGDTLSWADLVVAGYIIWLRIIWGEDNDKWQDIMGWHGGRWKNLIDNLKKYETIN